MAKRFGGVVGTALLFVATLSNTRVLAQTSSGNDPVWTTGWSNLGPATSLVLDPSHPSRLFAGTELGLATSEDGGRTWSVLDGTPASLRTLALDSSNAGRLFGGSGAGLFRSTDGGAHFSLTHSSDTGAVAIDPSQPNTVYTGGSGRVVRKSTDGGLTWSSTDLTLTATAIASLLVDPTRGNNVLAGLDLDPDFSYYYVYPALAASSDAGRTWRVFLDPNGPAETVRALAFDPRSSDVIYAATGAYVYHSRNGGARWWRSSFALGSEVTSLVVDSVTPEVIYAGTDHGVFRSPDAGLQWAPLPLLPNMDVRAIALDAPAQVLHAATAAGVYEMAVTAEAPSFPCHPSADALCLLGGRFRVRARAWDPRTTRFATGHAVPQTDAFGYFSLPDFTGDAALPEILLKTVDAEVSPWNSDWVFHGGLTDLWYVLTVTDTLTGSIRSYQNDPGLPYCGGADTAAFAAAGSPGGAAALLPLAPSGDALSLLSDRFRLSLAATDARTGRTVTGLAIPRQDGFGYFSLPDLTGDPDLPEVFVKMIDGRASNHSFWIFLSGMTDVAYTLTVLDTAAGEARSYQSPGAFCGLSDTSIPAHDPPPPANPHFELAGTVFDGVSPRAGATVSLLDAARVSRAATTSDVEGTFIFRGVPAGRWLVRADTGTRNGSVGVTVPPDDDAMRVLLLFDDPPH